MKTEIESINGIKICDATARKSIDGLSTQVSTNSNNIENINSQLAALTEVSSANINDTTPSTATTYSSSKIEDLVDDVSEKAVKTTVGTLSGLNTTAKTNLVDAINEVFQSASNGKSLIATAITGKGVPTSANDAFQTMANNIISILTGAKIDVFEQQNSIVKSYMEDVDYSTLTDHSATSMTSYENLSDKTLDKPVGQAVEGTGTLEVDDEWQKAITTSYMIYNEIPKKAHVYTLGAKVGILKPTGQCRMINCGGAWNIRDIGGWNASGGTVRYGYIYRGGTLANITDEGKWVLKNQCSVKHKLSLLGTTEEKDADNAILGNDIEAKRITVATGGYRDMVETDANRALTGQVLKYIIDSVLNEKPIYINCWSGRDRTGTVIALIMGILGCPMNDIDKEYELSSFTSENTTGYAHRNGYGYTRFLSYINALEGSNFEMKCINLAVDMGISKDILKLFRARMINGTPNSILNTYTISNSLTHVTSSNSAMTSVLEESSYTTTLTPSTGYTLATPVITMGGANITSSAYDPNTHVISIPNVTGDIVISCSASQITYTISNSLTHVSNSNLNTSIAQGSSYSATLTVDTGYNIGTPVITMGDTNITSSAYNSSTHTISIPNVTGNIVISCSATIKSFTITNTLTNTTNSNSATSANYGTSYSATLSLQSGYGISSITVTMNGTDITSSCYNSSTHVISISSVTGNIVITCVGKKLSALQLATDADGNIYNGKGWKENTRIASDGTEENYNGMYVTGFIPFRTGITLEFVNMQVSGTSNVTNAGMYRIFYYTAAKEKAGYVATRYIASVAGNNTVFDSTGNYITQITINDDGISASADTLAYFRLICPLITNDSEINIV